MIIINKIFVFASLFFFLVIITPCVSANSRIFSISPLFGVKYGHADEIVFKFQGQDQYLSHLIWDLKPLVYVGFGAELAPSFGRSGFFTAFSLKYGLPRLRTGFIENRDWNDIRHNDLTHFSKHDAFSRGAFLADISAGYSWHLADSFSVNAFLEFSYKHLSWDGRDGFFQYAEEIAPRQYGPWHDGIPKTRLFGRVISYSQNWFILSPGLSMRWNINRLFSLAGFISYSPLIFCIAKDTHWLRDITFYDYVRFGRHLKWGGVLVFTGARYHDFFLNFSHRRISGSRGDTRVVQGNAVSRYFDSAGAAYSAFDLGFGVKIRVR